MRLTRNLRSHLDKHVHGHSTLIYINFCFNRSMLLDRIAKTICIGSSLRWLQIQNKTAEFYLIKCGIHWELKKKRQSSINVKVERNLFKLSVKENKSGFELILYFNLELWTTKIAMFHLMTFWSIPFFSLAFFHQI